MVSPPTSAPHTTVYNVPDVLRQPSKTKTNSYWRTSSGSTSPTRVEVGKTVPKVDPNQSKTPLGRQIPGMSQNPVPVGVDTNKNILALTPVVSQSGPLKKFQGIKFSPSETNPASLRNISGVTPGQVKPELPNATNTVTKTVTQASGKGIPASGIHTAHTVFIHPLPTDYLRKMLRRP